MKIGDTLFFDTDVVNSGIITRIYFVQRTELDNRGCFTGYKYWNPAFDLENKDGFEGYTVISGCTEVTEEAINCRTTFKVMPPKRPPWARDNGTKLVLTLNKKDLVKRYPWARG